MNKTNAELLNQVTEEILEGVDTRSRRYAYKAKNVGTDWIGLAQNALLVAGGLFIVAVGIFLMLP